MLWANDADAGVVTTSAAYTTLPATFLQTPQLDQKWRTNDGLATAYVLVDLGSSKSIDFVALMAVNLTATGTVRIKVSTADATGAAGNAYDSTAYDPDILATAPHIVKVLTSPVTGRYVRLDLADAALSMFEAGRLIVGKLFRPEINFVHGYQLTTRDTSRVDESLGGQEWVERRVARRGVTVRFAALTTAERREHAVPMQLQRGISQDVGVVLDTASSYPAEDFIWGLPQALAPIKNTFLVRYDMELSVTERAWL